MWLILEGLIWEIMAWNTSCFLTERRFYFKSYTSNFITKGKFVSPEHLDASSFYFSFGLHFLLSCCFPACCGRQVVLQCSWKQKESTLLIWIYKAKCSLFQAPLCAFVYLHMVRTGLIYFHTFPYLVSLWGCHISYSDRHGKGELIIAFRLY